jgi:AbrB family looped-hinge helix DNA binding protein
MLFCFRFRGSLFLLCSQLSRINIGLELGRIVIPAKMRQKLDLKPSDTVCVVFDGKQIILKKIKK